MLDVCANTALSSSDGNSSNNNNSVSNGDSNKRLHLSAAPVSSDSEDPLLSHVPLVNKIRRYMAASHDSPFFSVEFFPPRTDKSACNLVRLLDKFRDGDPFFADITWHAAGNPGQDRPTSSITIAGVALNYCALDTMLHVTCIGMTKADLRQHLERAKGLGIRNILALRGDKHG